MLVSEELIYKYDVINKNIFACDISYMAQIRVIDALDDIIYTVCKNDNINLIDACVLNYKYRLKKLVFANDKLMYNIIYDLSLEFLKMLFNEKGVYYEM